MNVLPKQSVYPSFSHLSSFWFYEYQLDLFFSVLNRNLIEFCVFRKSKITMFGVWSFY
jgi:hypothetical protein